jgi:8-oxo-dGTP pyrophosphatase MutT (NUDIX family)
VHPDDPRTVVRDRVLAVIPADDWEAADQAAILDWIDSGAPLFRTVKPAIPPQHLAVYFALVDDDARCVMLVDHRKAQAWLLPGGHVDDGEDPRWSVEREAFEELQITPKFHEQLGSGQPLFLSITQTRGMDTHTDVTLWFALKGDCTAEIRPDPREFSEVRWYALDDHTDWSADCFDPHMHRFMVKLRSALDGAGQG